VRHGGDLTDRVRTVTTPAVGAFRRAVVGCGPMAPRLSPGIQRVIEVLTPLLGAFIETQQMIAEAGEDLCDFLAGNPQELAGSEYVEALQRWSEPKRRDWFAYVQSNPEAQATVAGALHDQLGIEFEAEDITMTNAAIAALAAAIRTVAGEGDEVIIVSP